MVTSFQRTRISLSHFFLFIFLLTLHITLGNIFLIKSNPVLYLTPIVAVIFSRTTYVKFTFFSLLVFSCGVIEDILANRFWGTSGIFCLVIFSLINSINEKFVRNLAKYIVTVCGLILYTVYEILSLIYLRSKYYNELLSISEIIGLQIVAFFFTFLIISMVYTEMRRERRIGRISVI